LRRRRRLKALLQKTTDGKTFKRPSQQTHNLIMCLS
jgi:hypothetical protein